jgi:predicted membrane protein
MHINLHLTDDTELRAHGFVAASGLFAEVQWDFSRHASRLSEGALWGTPAMMRQLAELAVQAAIQAEEEAAWQAHQRTTVAEEGSRVA